MSQASLLQFQRETTAEIARTNRYPRGALKVLDVLRTARGAWVNVLDLILLSNQINITARISELKHDMKYRVENNGRPGHESAYRLVEQMDDDSVFFVFEVSAPRIPGNPSLPDVAAAIAKRIDNDLKILYQEHRDRAHVNFIVARALDWRLRQTEIR